MTEQATMEPTTTDASNRQWLNSLDDQTALIQATRACRAVLLELYPLEGRPYGWYSGCPILVREAWEALDRVRPLLEDPSPSTGAAGLEGGRG